MTPAQTVTAFVAALNGGRLRDATDCFSRDGCLVTPDATAVHGRDEIGRLLAQLVDRRTTVEVVLSSELRGGEAALSRQSWLLRTDGADGSRYAQELQATLVLHRIEANWKLAIVSPWS